MRVKMNLFKHLIFIGCLLAMVPAIAANNEEVEMINATSCHVTSNGGHVIGYGTYIGAFSDVNQREPTTTIAPGSSGKVPIINENGQRFVLLDYDMASDRFSLNYHPGEIYILGYEDPKTYCNSDHYPPCLVLRNTNPCL